MKSKTPVVIVQLEFNIFHNLTNMYIHGSTVSRVLKFKAVESHMSDFPISS